MATYEYVCKSCTNIYTTTRSMLEEEVIPLCCGELTSRIWQPAPVMFKGSGFYSTGG
jgi:putative FmdB family regulatory protein